jgi:hypothetical protein
LQIVKKIVYDTRRIVKLVYKRQRELLHLYDMYSKVYLVINVLVKTEEAEGASRVFVKIWKKIALTQ